MADAEICPDEIEMADSVSPPTVEAQAERQRDGLALAPDGQGADRIVAAVAVIAATRTGGNQRRFSRDILRRVAIIRVAQSLGVPLSEISALLKPVPTGRPPTAAEIRAMIADWRVALQARIDGLSLLRDRLDGCIGCGCLTQAECPLRNPSDRLGARGKGPALLQGRGD